MSGVQHDAHCVIFRAGYCQVDRELFRFVSPFIWNDCDEYGIPFCGSISILCKDTRMETFHWKAIRTSPNQIVLLTLNCGEFTVAN